jgi:signal transduction histidine kinase
MRLPQVGLGIIYVLVVIAVEAVSSVGLYRGIGVTPWNPSAGFSVAIVFLGGVQFAPFVVLAHGISQYLDSVPWPSALFSAAFLLPCAVYIFAGLAMRHWPGFDPSLGSVRDCLRLIVLAVATAVFDTLSQIGALDAAGLMPGGHSLAVSWRSFIGSLVGVLTVTPLVLLLARPNLWPAPSLEQVAQFATLVVATLVVFGYPAATAYQLFYLLFLPVLWVALRYGITGSAAVLNLCQIAVIIGAQFRFGPSPGLAPLQTLLVVLVITGLLVGAVVTERQISAKRLRDQHGALNRALRLRSAGETAAAIAHEINQPLTALATYASVVDDALARGETALARETLAKLRKQCERAALVVTSVRELVKHGHLALEPVDLHHLVGELSDIHREELAARGVSLAIDIPRSLPRVWLDPTQMQQALHNLLNNSLEAIVSSGQRGAITISAHVDGASAAVVEVRDNGPGFPQGFEELASTPFLTTKQDGSGLGLAVARSVAEAHGGSLIIAPSSHGATVRLKLPITTEERWRTS